MTTATVDAQPVTQSGAQPGGTGVGIDWQRCQFGAADVGSVHPGSGLNQPESVLGDQGSAFACQHAHRLIVDQLAAQLISGLFVLGRRYQPALALGHHLAGDHHDVAVAQPWRRGGDGSTQVVAGPEFGKPRHGQDFDRRGGAVLTRRTGHAATPARSSPALTISAVASGSLISSGMERTATPSMSAWSPSCTSQQSRIPVPRRDP